MKKMRKVILSCVFCIAATTITYAADADAAGFGMGCPFADNAVLQREAEVPVWGTGKPGTEVSVVFAGQRVAARVGVDGRWIATLAPMAASSQGRDLVAECGGERCVATNVLVGEVFLCSGQSNMAQPLWSGGWGGGFSDRKGVIESRIANWPLFRYAKVSRCVGNKPTKLGWMPVTDAKTTVGTSAICYYFAITLLKAEPKVPVGIVNSSVGGTKIEAWAPGLGGTNFSSMIAPLCPFRFRSVLWYQGEANVRDGFSYSAKLHALAKGWRASLGDPRLFFVVSEIAPFAYGKGVSIADFWGAQQRFAEEDGDAVCVPINDCGDLGTIHPDRKELPATRFASIVLNRFYGRKDVPCAIPRAVRAEADAGGVIVRFDGVSVLGVNSHPKYTKHNVSGFEVCGDDGIWRKAKAAIDGSAVRVYAKEVPCPKKVRYLHGDDREGEVYSADSNFVPSAFELDVDYSSIDAHMQKKCQEICDWAVREGLQGALQFCAYRGGKCIVDVWAGTMTTNDGAAKIDGATLFPIFSTEKPLLATAVHRAVEKGKMEYGKPISTWWPEFRGGGKETLTLANALGYRSGMSHAFPKGVVGVDDQCNWGLVCSLAAEEPPVDVPGTVQRYLSMSYAWIIGRPLELAMRKPLNSILMDEVLLPCAIENDFYFAADDDAIRRTATVYKSRSFESMNDDRRRRMCLPSAFAVSDARAIARFYNRLCGFDGRTSLVAAQTLDAALRPCRHADDPVPADIDKEWRMVFGMGYGLWGESSDISRVFGHGGIGGSEGLCDRSQKLIVGFTCNFGKDVRKVRSKLYGVVGMKWRYWNDDEADIQDLQMSVAPCAAASSAADDAQSCHEAEWHRFIDPPPGYASFPRQVRKTASHVRNGLVVECYEQANGPGTHQRVMLALPEGASGRLPAVVVPFYFPEAMLGFNPVDGSNCVTGLVDHATNLAYYASIPYMSDLARRGYVAISADAYYLTYATDVRPKNDWEKWGHVGRALTRDWAGWTGIGKLVFDTRLLVDMLVADRRIDASRIGILGHSLGGKMSFYTGCLDKRIKVIVASDFGIGWDQTNWQDVWYWGECLKDIRGTGATHADLLTMSHGKPFCLIAGLYDNDESGKIMRMAKGYEGHPDRLVLLNHATGHRPPREATEAGYRFLDRFLLGTASSVFCR